jgi:aryl-alcohol dehydrogenase-like predicted oxidoreductase
MVTGGDDTRGMERDRWVWTSITEEEMSSARVGRVAAVSAGNHRKKIISSIEARLRRLQTDHIDLYYVHARDLLTGVEELMRALGDQMRLGKALYPAVSDWAGGRRSL